MTNAPRRGGEMTRLDRQGHLAPGNALRGSAVLCIAEEDAWVDGWLLPTLRSAGASVEVAAPCGPLPALPAGCRLVLLCVGLHDEFCFSYCAKVRKDTRLPLMLMLHGAAREQALLGYEAGADACVNAPCDPREFLARAAALVRRELAWQKVQ